MDSGEYQEKLPCGGTLIVSKNSWKIQYYFRGPDMRYNGDFVNVPGSDIEKYISAFIENWQDYEQLLKKIPGGGELTKQGKMGMTIRIGKFFQGVCLKSYHMPISSSQQLNKVIDSYRFAAKRAPQIQAFLESLK
jgi:hypothetical protein